MKTAVTGGSGVVGAAVIRHLVEAGHEVNALVRSDKAAVKLRATGATPVVGDVLEPESLAPLLLGCDWVFHVAGVNELCSLDPRHMWEVNVEGTRNVVASCRAATVGRLIHTSSAVTIGEESGVVATEETPHRGYYLSDYERSKTEAERVVFAEAGALDVISVNPSSVQGPGRATGTGGMVLRAARGKMRYVVDTTISLVDIDDCARGHLAAAEKGVPGERYLLSGATVTMAEAIEMLSEATGRELRPRYLPTGLAVALSIPLELAYRLAGRLPPVCREAVRVISHGHRYDGSRATRELGVEYTPLVETIRRTIDWFRAEGLVEESWPRPRG